MAIQFNADEALQMSEEIERNGARFYRRAAGQAAEPHGRDLLLRLAGMEDDHERTFMSMRMSLSEEERKPITFDPDNESALYLKAMADRQVFDAADPNRRLSGQETMEQLLQVGMQVEKDSIVFYLGLKDVVPPRLGRGRIDDIIKEEMGHLGDLSAMLADLLS